MSHARQTRVPQKLGGRNTCLGERCELPQRGLGGNRIWCILSLKYDIWWQKFYFPENQLTKFSAVLQFKHSENMKSCFVGLLCCFVGQCRLQIEGHLLY